MKTTATLLQAKNKPRREVWKVVFDLEMGKDYLDNLMGYDSFSLQAEMAIAKKKTCLMPRDSHYLDFGGMEDEIVEYHLNAPSQPKSWGQLIFTFTLTANPQKRTEL